MQLRKCLHRGTYTTFQGLKEQLHFLGHLAMSGHFIQLLTFHFISLSQQIGSMVLRGKGADGCGMGHRASLSQDDSCASSITTEKLSKLFVIGASQIKRDSWDWSALRKDSGDVISMHIYLKGSSKEETEPFFSGAQRQNKRQLVQRGR